MRILLKAALKTKSHFSWLCLTFGTLFLLTLADQMEMVSLGVVVNTSSDFFSLFSDSDHQGKKTVVDHIDRQAVIEKWDQIDTDQKGTITRQDASIYLSSQKGLNPITKLLHKLKTRLHLDQGRFQIVLIMLLIVSGVKSIFLFFSRYTTRTLATRISRDLRQQYFEHIQMLPMSFFQKYNIGTLSSRVVGDAMQIALSINSWITNYLHTPFIVLTTLTACFYFSWQLSLVVFVGIPLIVLPIQLITRKVKKVTRQLQRNQEKFSTVLIDFLAGIQTVKIFSMERFTFFKYKEQNDLMERLESKTNKYDLLTRPTLHFVTTFCLISVLFFGLYYLKMSLAELIVFCGLLHIFYEPIRKFADENANVQKGVVAAERLFEVLNIQSDIRDEPGAIDLQTFKDKIEFDRVWFRYENEWVLKDVSFTIKKGESVAIVGATGSGKSTILQLIPRLYDVCEGEIKIDGLPLKAYAQESVRKQLAYVSQKPFLFNASIRENIAYGRKLPTEKIQRAAKKAYADEFIEEMADGYDSILSELGKNLSGGQQQRLAIARALAKESPILILDEATSSLDSVSEDKIKTAIENLHGEITQIIVAHRLSTIEHVDKIIFIEKGIKIAEGSKAELYKNCPEFKLMWDIHFKAKDIEEPKRAVLDHV